MEIKPLKNFISVCLGMVVRRNRNRLGLSYTDVAAKTGIKSSYFQAFEQGNVVFHVSKAYGLYRLFKDVFPESLNGFIELLSIISIVEARGIESKDEYLKECGKKDVKPTLEGNNSAYLDGLRKAYIELARANFAYHRLHMRFLASGIYVRTDNDQIIETIEEQNLTNEIELFISDYINYAAPLGRRIQSSLNELIDFIPSPYLSFVEGIRNSISTLPTHFKRDDMASWEVVHANQIVELVFIMDVEFYLIDTFKNLPLEYLSKKQFQRATFYCNSDRAYNQYTPDYIKKHLADLGENFNDKKWDEIKYKLDLNYIQDKDTMHKIFDDIKLDRDDYNFMWIYYMKDRTYAAFYSQASMNDNDEKANIHFLSVRQLRDKLDLISVLTAQKADE